MTVEDVLIANTKIDIEIIQRECESTLDGFEFQELPDAGWGDGYGRRITIRMHEAKSFDTQGWILMQLKWLCDKPADAVQPCTYGDDTICGFTMDITGDEYGKERQNGKYDIRYMFDIKVGGHTMTGRSLETIFPLLKS